MGPGFESPAGHQMKRGHRHRRWSLFIQAAWGIRTHSIKLPAAAWMPPARRGHLHNFLESPAGHQMKRGHRHRRWSLFVQAAWGIRTHSIKLPAAAWMPPARRGHLHNFLESPAGHQKSVSTFGACRYFAMTTRYPLSHSFTEVYRFYNKCWGQVMSLAP